MNAQTACLVILFSLLSVVSVALMRYVFNIYNFEFNIPFIVKLVFNPLMITALISALGCRLIFYSMFKNLSMSETFLVTQVSAVFILIAGYFLFHDTLTKKQIIGAILILIGVGLV